MAKVSKNSRVAQRIAGSGGKDYIKLVKSVKNPATGTYSFKTTMVHKERIKEALAEK